MDRIYRLTVRITLVAAVVLAVVTTATAVSFGLPQMTVWVVLAVVTGVYARHRLTQITRA
jgi:hypothetical protein